METSSGRPESSNHVVMDFNEPMKASDRTLSISIENFRSVINSVNQRDLYDKVTSALRKSFPHYSWVGIYLLAGDELVLRGSDGDAPSQHERIPVGTGICGAAARSGRTIIVPNVAKDPRYLMCFPSTKSEIVVPIRKGAKVLGEIDVDSDQTSAFTSKDKAFLETLAKQLANRIASKI